MLFLVKKKLFKKTVPYNNLLIVGLFVTTFIIILAIIFYDKNILCDLKEKLLEIFKKKKIKKKCMHNIPNLITILLVKSHAKCTYVYP